MILIKMEDGGPVFYCGKRLGVKMQEFSMYKFRTMKVAAEDIRNADGSTYNSNDDPRLTKIGRILRKSSLDEIPQILNVLKGDMSIVGPRPSPLGNTDKYSAEYIKKFDVKPGITGYNQVKLRNKATVQERIENDLFYINKMSLRLDIEIMLLTILKVFRKEGVFKE